MVVVMLPAALLLAGMSDLAFLMASAARTPARFFALLCTCAWDAGLANSVASFSGGVLVSSAVWEEPRRVPTTTSVLPSEGFRAFTKPHVAGLSPSSIRCPDPQVSLPSGKGDIQTFLFSGWKAPAVLFDSKKKKKTRLEFFARASKKFFRFKSLLHLQVVATQQQPRQKKAQPRVMQDVGTPGDGHTTHSKVYRP